jgi:hypothetical protein
LNRRQNKQQQSFVNDPLFFRGSGLVIKHLDV